MSAPAVAVSSDGKTFAAAWMDQRTGKENRDVYWSVGPSLDFRTEKLLHEDSKGIQDHPALAFDEDGIVWAAWEDGRTGRKRIRARSSAPGAEEREVSEDPEGAAGFPALACAGGLVAVVYEANNEGENLVCFRVIQDSKKKW